MSVVNLSMFKIDLLCSGCCSTLLGRLIPRKSCSTGEENLKVTSDEIRCPIIGNERVRERKKE